MMGRLKSEQGQLFYEFHLGDAVPEDHLVRKIDTALDLSWLRGELAPHYSSMGRPSVDAPCTFVNRKADLLSGRRLFWAIADSSDVRARETQCETRSNTPGKCQ